MTWTHSRDVPTNLVWNSNPDFVDLVEVALHGLFTAEKSRDLEDVFYASYHIGNIHPN